MEVLQLGMSIICEYVIAYFAKTHISHIFPHIMAFTESHMRILCHICKNLHIFAHVLHISAYVLHISAYVIAFLVPSFPNVVLRLLHILAANDY